VAALSVRAGPALANRATVTNGDNGRPGTVANGVNGCMTTSCHRPNGDKRSGPPEGNGVNGQPVEVKRRRSNGVNGGSVRERKTHSAWLPSPWLTV